MFILNIGYIMHSGCLTLTYQPHSILHYSQLCLCTTSWTTTCRETPTKCGVMEASLFILPTHCYRPWEKQLYAVCIKRCHIWMALFVELICLTCWTQHRLTHLLAYIEVTDKLTRTNLVGKHVIQIRILITILKFSLIPRWLPDVILQENFSTATR